MTAKSVGIERAAALRARGRLTSIVGVAVLATVARCRAEQRPPADTARSNVSATPAPEPKSPRAVPVVPLMFRTLSWIEGRWRGSDSAQLVFYEEYRFADDSTIRMRSFADSTFTRATDSSTIALRQGRVENVSASATWVATMFNGNFVHFAPVRGANNRFIWERAPNGWSARLFPPEGSGSTRDRLYHMTPMSR